MQVGRAVSPDTWGLLMVGLAVLAANLPYLLGVLDPNPLGPRSGLLSGLTLGPLRGQPTIDPNVGFISQAAGHRAALDWLHLRVPWWNPYEGTGTPLVAEMQSAALFPLTIFTALSNGQLYEHICLEIVAGASTYLLLRRIGIRRWVSVAAGVAFALNGTFAWLSHATVNPVAFLPLLLLGIELTYAATSTNRSGGWWLIAVALALSLYAGFPEVAYIDALLAACWFGWRCGYLNRSQVVRFAGKAAAGTATAALLVAPLVVAWLAFAPHADLAKHAGGYYASVHQVSQGLPQLLLPYIYGPIFGFTDPKFTLLNEWGRAGGFLSTSLLLFALLGVLASGRRGLRAVLALWIALALARIYGMPVVREVFGVLPGMSQVAFYRYAFPSVELAVVVLGALGMDTLTSAPAGRRRLLPAALVAVALVASAGIGARSLTTQLGSVFSHRPYYAGSIAWGLAVLAAVAIAVLLDDGRLRRAVVGAVVVVDAMVLFAVPEFSAPRYVRTDTRPVDYLKRHLGQSRYFTLGPLQPNYGSYFGIASLNINDVPLPTAFRDYVHQHLDQAVDPRVFVGNQGGGRSAFVPSPQQELLRNLDGYRAASVAYVLTPAGQSLPQTPATFTLVFRSPSTWIYRLNGTAPYFTTGAGCTVKPGGRTSVRLSCSRPTTLVRRETYLSGWSAHVDGHPVRVRQFRGLFQSLTVPAGSHVIRFSYRPPDLGWALLAFGIGCACLLVPRARGRGWRLARRS